MKTKILIEFDVEPLEEDLGEDEFDERVAKGAASMAAFDFLTFCTVSGVNTDTDAVEVHVDGFGKCRVKLGEDHE
jgi:hypothetical protein